MRPENGNLRTTSYSHSTPAAAVGQATAAAAFVEEAAHEEEAQEVGAGRKCGCCGESGHTRRACPDIAYDKPTTPNPDAVVTLGAPIAVIDLEWSEDIVNEIGGVIAVNPTGDVSGWTWEAAEYRVVTGDYVGARTRCLCPGLADDAAQSTKTGAGLVNGLISWIEKK